MLVIPRGQGIKGEVRSRNDMTSVSAIIRTYEIYNLPQIEMLKLALPFNFFSNEPKNIRPCATSNRKKKTQNPGHRSRTRFTKAATALTVIVIAKNHILGQMCPLV